MIARAEPLGIEVVTADPEEVSFTDDFFGAIIQYPDAFGEVCDYRKFVEKTKAFSFLLQQ